VPEKTQLNPKPVYNMRINYFTATKSTGTGADVKHTWNTGTGTGKIGTHKSFDYEMNTSSKKSPRREGSSTGINAGTENLKIF
jgi:hypothetical protein